MNNSHQNMARIMDTKKGDIKSSQLLLLLNWMSPAFPIGAYAYSHGLEWAIEDGQVESADDVESWIAEVITRGSGWNDAVLFAQEYQTRNMNELALALCSSRERYLETTQLGAAFMIAADIFAQSKTPLRRSAPPPPQWGEVPEGRRGALAYPIAAARACKFMGVELNHALLAFLQGFSNALISVAVRLVPLGQTAGLETMRNLMPVIADTAKRVSTSSLDDLGSCTLLSDIAAMKHETQHSRIFRT
jgi:urease accessory protein